MKAGFLYLLLLCLISNVYSLDEKIVSSKTLPTTTTSAKTIPMNTLTTRCSTKIGYDILSTNAPLKTTGASIPVYTAVKKVSKVCAVGPKRCETVTTRLHDFGSEMASFVPIPCKNVELIKNDDVVAIADAYHYKDFIPPEIRNSNGGYITGEDHTEYFISDKTLYCYNKHYEVRTYGTIRDMCTTYVTVIDDGTTTEKPTTTSKVISTKIVPTTTTTTTTTKTKTISTKSIPTTTTTTTTTKTISTKVPPNVTTTTTTTKTISTKAPPSVTTTTTTTKTISTKAPPSVTTTTTTTKTISTKAPPSVTTTTTTTKIPPSSTCKNVITVTVTEKETITKKETVTVTVHGSSPTPTDDKKPMKNCAGRWGQCGGKNFNGPTCCESGYQCKRIDEYYSQCL